MQNINYFIFRYKSEHIDELKLNRGDIIKPLTELEHGWWFGKKILPINENSDEFTHFGVFPSNYVHCFKIKLDATAKEILKISINKR